MNDIGRLVEAFRKNRPRVCWFHCAARNARMRSHRGRSSGWGRRRGSSLPSVASMFSPSMSTQVVRPSSVTLVSFSVASLPPAILGGVSPAVPPHTLRAYAGSMTGTDSLVLVANAADGSISTSASWRTARAARAAAKATGSSDSQSPRASPDARRPSHQAAARLGGHEHRLGIPFDRREGRRRQPEILIQIALHQNIGDTLRRTVLKYRRASDPAKGGASH